MATPIVWCNRQLQSPNSTLRCALPGLLNDTYEIQNEAHQDIINLTIPPSEDELHLYSQCQMYGPNGYLISCDKWVYDKSVFDSTFTSEQNLVCGDKLKTSHASMIFFGGVLLGAFGLGTLSDFVGRRKTMFLSTWLFLLSAIPLSWASSFWVFCTLRFIIGMCTSGLYIAPFVLGMELVGPSKRVWAGIVVDYFFASGLVVLVGVGYLIRDWMYLELTVSVPIVLFLFYWWFVVSMGYYGLSLNTGNLSGDFYINFLLSGLAEFPAYTLCLLLLDRVGRRKLHVSCMILGGVACICTIFTTLYAGEDLQPITVALAMLGKVGIAAAYGIIYVWSAELYPTVVRNAGVGISSTFANLGAMISSYIADISKVVDGNVGRAVPLVIFGGCSIMAGLLAILLPETFNRNLPETIEDGIHFTKKWNKDIPVKTSTNQSNGAKAANSMSIFSTKL